MALDTDDLAKIQVAVMAGKDFESSNLRDTAEMRAAFAEIKQQYANAPAGSMVEIVSDIEWGSADALREKTERAHGITYW